MKATRRNVVVCVFATLAAASAAIAPEVGRERKSTCICFQPNT
jgi:hypothetical protein